MSEVALYGETFFEREREILGRERVSREIRERKREREREKARDLH